MVFAGNLLAGRYQLDEPIGTGWFSEVWRATDAALSRPVAVKLLHPAYARQPEALARFRAGALNAAALWHENIAHIYDYDEPAEGPQPYLVMELVDGPSLAGVLAWRSAGCDADHGRRRAGCGRPAGGARQGPWFTVISGRGTSCLPPAGP